MSAKLASRLRQAGAHSEAWHDPEPHRSPVELCRSPRNLVDDEEESGTAAGSIQSSPCPRSAPDSKCVPGASCPT